MTVQEAKAIIKKTKSPMLRRDLLKFIKRQERLTTTRGDN